jgi:hypothetical protein
MHYFEGEPLIINSLDDLDANGSTKLISLLDQAKLFQDLLRTILGVIGRAMKQQEQHFFDK